MKRFAIIAVMALMSLGAPARTIHYFTYSQAARTVNYLNTQNELMIYCGYDYEIETYVLINEIWMERVNSSYYEIWLYGFDAYTGDEIYMPLDLQCIWLLSGGHLYNAAQYLRFRVDVRVPNITWRIPPYNPYTRVAHPTSYRRTYHYDIHRHGWMPPAYTYGPGVPPPPLPYYYMRRPSTPAPMPTRTWTPGQGRPEVVAPTSNSYYIGNTTTATNPSSNSNRNSSTRNATTAPSRNSGNATPSSTSSSRNSSTATTTSTTRSRTTTTTSTPTTTTTRNSSGSSTRGTATTTSTTRSRTTTTSTPTTTPTRNSSGSSTRGTATTTSSTRSRTTTATSTTTPTRNSNSNSNNTTSSSTRSNSSTRNATTATRTR